MREYQDWKKDSTAVVEKIVPLAEKHKVILAMENHKDRTVDEFVALLKSFSSEYYGSLIDFGNNIALCEESMSVVRKLAPYV
jgi:3-oxoisoapionate decarboxylase